MRRLIAFVALLMSAALPAAGQPMPVKVVVLAAFEPGQDQGDAPGELQYWVERYPLPHTLKVAGVDRPVRYSDDGVLAVVTGMRARPREALAALILSDRFDLSKAYWIVAGVAGADPRTASIGSAAWARWVVDADPAYEMDERDTPEDWPWGLYSPGADRPRVKGSAEGSSGMAWKLNPGLVNWAYGLTRNVALPDGPELEAARVGYPEEPAALKPPGVLIGDVLGTTRFWHGERRTRWARDWVRMWTNGAGVFVMADGEDQGTLDVLTLYGKEGRVDMDRVLVLRAASNYSRQPKGTSPAPKFTEGGLVAGLEAAWRAGSPVVKALVDGWADYASTPPGGPTPAGRR